MQPDSEGKKPFSESNLDSPAYRERLMRKLNTLIAVLEVAQAKVKKALTGPAPDTERLQRISKNLTDTLSVCTRARTALERRGKLSADLTADLAKVNPDLAASARNLSEGRDLDHPAGRGQDVEFSSELEKQRFEKMGRIRPEELWTCDVEQLARRLQD
jgi:hypothetical protein